MQTNWLEMRTDRFVKWLLFGRKIWNFFVWKEDSGEISGLSDCHIDSMYFEVHNQYETVTKYIRPIMRLFLAHMGNFEVRQFYLGYSIIVKIHFKYRNIQATNVPSFRNAPTFGLCVASCWNIDIEFWLQYVQFELTFFKSWCSVSVRISTSCDLSGEQKRTEEIERLKLAAKNMFR